MPPMSSLKVPTSNSHGFGRAPGDLLIEIALLLEARQDILHLCLTSSYVFANVSSVLYGSVVLKSAEQCKVTLNMLTRRTYIARHVRQLIIRPYGRRSMVYNAIDSETAATAVRRIAGAKVLDALVKFEWDDDELPCYDDMWFALRLGCPQLRYVSTSLGARLPRLNSHLFDFQNLSGVSVNLKHGFYEHNIDLFIQSDTPIFKPFWRMLLLKCPNLEELVFDGWSSLPIDIHFLVEGRWPKLRKLVLGDVCVDWFPTSLVPGEKRPFIDFLEAHPLLESLSLSRHTIQPMHFNALSASALPNVTYFSGTHQQLQAMPHLHRNVKAVTFCDPVETREVSSPTVASLLRDLRSLTDLRIAFTLHSMYDSGNLLRSLIQSCPTLRHLELTCGHKPSFQIDAFAKTIRGFPKLCSLDLTIVKYPGDETISSGAARIARSNPRLKNFSLTFIPPVYPVPLPFAIPYRAFLFAFAFPSQSSGRFEVRCDSHGLPLLLSGFERSRFRWPYGMAMTTRTRKYVKDLRPPSYPGRRQSGLKGLLALLFEKSSAGEEMRMILFCTFLAFLAACGISANRKVPKISPPSVQEVHVAVVS